MIAQMLRPYSFICSGGLWDFELYDGELGKYG